jgi:hypothetical protein
LAAGGRRRQRGVGDNTAALARELRGTADRVGEVLEHVRRQAAAQPSTVGFCATAVDGLAHLQITLRRLAGAVLVLAVNPTATDLNATVTALARAIRRSLPRGVSLRLSLAPAAPLCRADPDATAAAVLDLAKAAMSDMAGGGELAVGTRQYAIDADMAAETPDAIPGD